MRGVPFVIGFQLEFYADVSNDWNCTALLQDREFEIVIRDKERAFGSALTDDFVEALVELGGG